MATDPAGQAPAADMVDLLRGLIETYGRGICREPQTVAAMLRDLCPERRRENFLLVSALRERVVPELLGSLDSVPTPILVNRCTRKLSDNLGLSEDSARWAVESWLGACPAIAAAPDLPLRTRETETASEPGSLAAQTPARSRPVDWLWLALCASGILCSGLAIATVARMTFYHYWDSLRSWLTETGLLTAGLALAGGGLTAVARQIRSRAAPNQRALDPERAAFAMLLEVLTLLALPMAPVVSVGLWAAEWIGELHVSGQPHDLSFQLGRILQSLVLGLFLFVWVREMTVVQGRIASSMVRRR